MLKYCALISALVPAFCMASVSTPEEAPTTKVSIVGLPLNGYPILGDITISNPTRSAIRIDLKSNTPPVFEVAIDGVRRPKNDEIVRSRPSEEMVTDGYLIAAKGKLRLLITLCSKCTAELGKKHDLRVSSLIVWQSVQSDNVPSGARQELSGTTDLEFVPMNPSAPQVLGHSNVLAESILKREFQDPHMLIEALCSMPPDAAGPAWRDAFVNRKLWWGFRTDAALLLSMHHDKVSYEVLRDLADLARVNGDLTAAQLSDLANQYKQDKITP